MKRAAVATIAAICLAAAVAIGGGESASLPAHGAATGGVTAMVAVPGGWFEIGCSADDPECFSDERPARWVYIHPFSIDATEVTQAQFAAVMGTNPSHFNGYADRPVEDVGWDQARAFCAKVGKRLPTEAEWEFAARGGTTGPRYGDLAEVAFYYGNANAATHPVGQMRPNAYGLYDMLGNVWEWCADTYDEGWYARMPEDNPVNDSGSSPHVRRGGSWNDFPRLVRVSVRNKDSLVHLSGNTGIRCARN